MWVYWGKLGHLKTSSQEGAVLERQLQGTQRGEVGGAASESKVGENVLWPLLLALGRHRPRFSPGGWATALNSSTPSKWPEPGRSVQGVPLVWLGVTTVELRGCALHWESGPGIRVLLSLCILGACRPLPCASVLSSAQWAGTVSAFDPAASPALSAALPSDYSSDGIPTSYKCFSYEVAVPEDQRPGGFSSCQSHNICQHSLPSLFNFFFATSLLAFH